MNIRTILSIVLIAPLLLLAIAAPRPAAAFTPPNVWNPSILNGPLITCTGGGAAGGVENKNCQNLCDLINTFVNVVYFGIGVVLWILSPIFLAIGGIMLLVAGGRPEMLGTAKKTLTGTLVGILIVILGWLAINTVVTVLGITGIGGFGTETCAPAPDVGIPASAPPSPPPAVSCPASNACSATNINGCCPVAGQTCTPFTPDPNTPSIIDYFCQ